jgi:hypothetical protein
LPIKADLQNFAMILVKERKGSNPSIGAPMGRKSKRREEMYWRITGGTSENIHPRRAVASI